MLLFLIGLRFQEGSSACFYSFIEIQKCWTLCFEYLTWIYIYISEISQRAHKINDRCTRIYLAEHLLKAQTQSINTLFKLIQLKWLIRVCITANLLDTFGANILDVCVFNVQLRLNYSTA